MDFRIYFLWRFDRVIIEAIDRVLIIFTITLPIDLLLIEFVTLNDFFRDDIFLIYNSKKRFEFKTDIDFYNLLKFLSGV